MKDAGPVRILRINRPQALNAISGEVGEAVANAFAAAAANTAVRAIVITGTGTRAFSAGGDLKEMAASGQARRRSARVVYDMLKDRPDTPVVAAVNGLALGGGLELVLACDLAVSSVDATFAVPEVSRGILASGGGLVRLPQVVGPRRAMELALTGKPIDAATALEWGLVNEVVTAAEVLPAALRLDEAIARNAPLAVAASKRMIRDASRLPEHEAWSQNDQHYATVAASEDALEGPRAFAAGRAPEWTGR